jgi:hypothetical protein
MYDVIVKLKFFTKKYIVTTFDNLTFEDIECMMIKEKQLERFFTIIFNTTARCQVP